MAAIHGISAVIARIGQLVTMKKATQSQLVANSAMSAKQRKMPMIVAKY